MDCLFCQIVDKKIPTEIVYEDENFMAFNDIHPKAPLHVLVIPKKHIATLNDLKDEDTHLMGGCLQTVKKIAAEKGVAENGYNVLINCNAGGGQEIYHLHLHLLGKKRLRLSE